MPTIDPERMHELLRPILRASKEGKANWQQTKFVGREEAETTDFRYSLELGHVRIRSRDQDGLAPYRFLVYKGGEKVDELESEWFEGDIAAPWNRDLAELYRLARMKAFKTDEILDEFIETFPEEPRPKDDIPF